MYGHKKRRLKRIMSILTLLLLSLPGAAATIQAQEECLQCHGDEGSSINRSVHDFLSCTSCHTEIESFPHPEGASLSKQESVQTCGGCHQGRIAESYAKSFHGKAVHLGSQESAACLDCHGAHDILESEKPESRVAKENIPQTCAACHGEASPGFAEGSDHFLLASAGAGAPMYFTAKFFTWLTIITIVGMVIHIELQLYHNLRTILRERKRR